MCVLVTVMCLGLVVLEGLALPTTLHRSACSQQILSRNNSRIGPKVEPHDGLSLRVMCMSNHVMRLKSRVHTTPNHAKELTVDF
ncbi:hypothetical protein J6590_048445 [Homalodisca vitripennis]|nr:hypothetical protein J6590_048445 [Homalodisca vitripennis]